jgi:glycosyltransferase involved in cell wall biosynthesis
VEEFMKNQVRRPKLPRVVILTPVYNEEESLLHFEQAVADLLLSRRDYDFHVLFIDDGSRDRSWEVIQEISERNSRFQGIRLSRNYGSHIALSAGFANAHGDAIATLACDLQDPPEVILDFLERWRSGAQIVWGRRQSRKDDFVRILPSRIFFRLMRRFAMPYGSKFTTGSFLLVDRQVAKCLCQFHEHNRITFALVAWTGFDQATVEYDRRERIAGKSGWNFRKMIKTMYDAFIGFSFLPIKIMKLLGVGVSLLTIPLSAYLMFSWFTGDPLMGWTSLMLSIAFFFGIQFLLMGIVGEYLYRIYAEAVRRPLYFISEKTDHSDTSDTNAE